MVSLPCTVSEVAAAREIPAYAWRFWLYTIFPSRVATLSGSWETARFPPGPLPSSFSFCRRGVRDPTRGGIDTAQGSRFSVRPALSDSSFCGGLVWRLRSGGHGLSPYAGRPTVCDDAGFRWTSNVSGQLTLVLILSLVISLVAQTRRRKREVLILADELDRRVQTRTQELAKAVEALESEIAQHKRTEQGLQTQLERLNLLDQITRAIGERQDLRSIFQVVVRSLEDNLPIDFGCVCLYDRAGRGSGRSPASVCAAKRWPWNWP